MKKKKTQFEIMVIIDSVAKTRRINPANYVLFLDEFSSIIEYLIISDTLNNKRSNVYKVYL